MGSHSLLHGIFPTQGLNPGLPRCRRILYQLSHQGSPTVWLREFCSVLHGSLEETEAWGRMDPCMCVAESLCCPPETITTLFVNWLYPSTRGKKVYKRAGGFLVEKQASQSENKSFIKGYSVCEACDRSWRGTLKATHQWTWDKSKW